MKAKNEPSCKCKQGYSYPTDTVICRCPIVMERVQPLKVVIRFPDRWLGFKNGKSARRRELAQMLRELDYPPGATVHVIANSIAIIESIGLSGELTSEAEEILTRSAQEVIRTALTYFGEKSGDALELVGDYGYIEKIHPSERFEAILQKTGVKAANELERWTREEICQLPGMRTDDVLILELVMSSRGLFLKKSPLPPF